MVLYIVIGQLVRITLVLPLLGPVVTQGAKGVSAGAIVQVPWGG